MSTQASDVAEMARRYRKEVLYLTTEVRAGHLDVEEARCALEALDALYPQMRDAYRYEVFSDPAAQQQQEVRRDERPEDHPTR